MPTNTFDNILTVEDVAEKIHVKPETVRTWLRTGRLGGTKIGRNWLITESNIRKALNGAGEVENE